MNRFANPDEVAAAIAFLLSEDTGFITGQTIFVDGGASIVDDLASPRFKVHSDTITDEQALPVSF